VIRFKGVVDDVDVSTGVRKDDDDAANDDDEVNGIDNDDAESASREELLCVVVDWYAVSTTKRVDVVVVV